MAKKNNYYEGIKFGDGIESIENIEAIRLGDFKGSNPSTWMTDDPFIREMTLDQITMLGSHDSGMSVYEWHNVDPGCIVTQYCDIAKQLRLGVRYFDIRPYLWIDEKGNNHGFYCGHFSNILGAKGGFGQSLSSVICQVNEFCKGKKELIILNVGHIKRIEEKTLYTEITNLHNEDWEMLSAVFNNLTDLCRCNTCYLCNDISSRKTIGELTADKSAVVVLDQSGALIGDFCQSDNLDVYNEYANSSSVKTMMEDQFSKLLENGNKQDQLFLLSWTLTQNFPITKSILELADEANSYLEEVKRNASSTSIYPHIVYIDGIKDETGFSVVQFINALRGNNYVGISLRIQDDKIASLSSCGKFEHVISDSEAVLFGVTPDNLKGAINNYFGKTPNDVFLRSPTPWDDLYKRFSWPEVKLRFEVDGPLKIDSFDVDRTVLIEKKITNDTQSKKTFDVEMEQVGYDIIWPTGWISEDENLGFNDSPNGWNNISFINYLVTFPTLNIQEGNPLLKTRILVDEGKARCKNAKIKCSRKVELEPGQTVNARLYLDFIKAKVLFPFKSSLSGYVAVNYDPVYKDHHFWGLPIKEIMQYNGICNNLKTTMVLELSYNARPTIEFE